MDWDELAKAVTAGLVLLGGQKFVLGRSAKKADTYKRATKEVAVVKALLKLRVAASAPKSTERIRAKEQAYQKAQAIEEQFERELRELLPTPEAQWFRDATIRNKLLPKRYEGKPLTGAKKFAWWAAMAISYVTLLLFLFFLLCVEYIVVHAQFMTPKQGLLSVALLLLFIILTLLCAWGFYILRTYAYALSLKRQFTTT